MTSITRTFLSLLLLGLFLSGPACSGDDATDNGADAAPGADASGDAEASAGDTTGPEGDTSEPGGDASDPTGEDAVDGDPGGTPDVPPPPPNPNAPPPVPTYAGTCPTLVAGAQKFTSGELARDVTVALPAKAEGAGVLFLWHGFGDTGPNFSAMVGAQAIATKFNVITVSAQAVVDPLETEKLSPLKDLAAQFVGPLPPTWSIIDGPELDLQLFDDLHACLDEQFGVDPTRLYTMGFSQGALWSTVLILERSKVLASALLWSGGLGSTGGLIEVVRLAYQAPERKIPVLAGSGGAADIWPNAQLKLVDFAAGSAELVEALTADGHAAALCDHGLGHTVPPGGLGWGLQFLFDHVWTPKGDSSYFGHAGDGFPEYCSFPQ